MTAPKADDFMADLRGVVRIAKAASFGIHGNGPRIERAEAAIAAVAELIRVQRGCRDMLREAAKQLRLNGDHGHGVGCDQHADAADAALARVGGAA